MSCLLLFYCSNLYTVTEPGVPYTVTVRASTVAGKGEPVSIICFAVQQGNNDHMAEDSVQMVVTC